MEHDIERGDVQGYLFKSRKQVMRKTTQQHRMIVFRVVGLRLWISCLGPGVWDSERRGFGFAYGLRIRGPKLRARGLGFMIMLVATVRKLLAPISFAIFECLTAPSPAAVEVFARIGLGFRV